jgi:hypothetical protein
MTGARKKSTRARHMNQQDEWGTERKKECFVSGARQEDDTRMTRALATLFERCARFFR